MPNYLRRAVVGQVETRLVEIIGVVCADHRADVIEVEIMPDHVHLLVEARSSRVLRQEFAHLRQFRSPWTPSWFVLTVGGAPLEIIRHNVDSQTLAA